MFCDISHTHRINFICSCAFAHFTPTSLTSSLSLSLSLSIYLSLSLSLSPFSLSHCHRSRIFGMHLRIHTDTTSRTRRRTQNSWLVHNCWTLNRLSNPLWKTLGERSKRQAKKQTCWCLWVLSLKPPSVMPFTSPIVDNLSVAGRHTLRVLQDRKDILTRPGGWRPSSRDPKIPSAGLPHRSWAVAFWQHFLSVKGPNTESESLYARRALLENRPRSCRDEGETSLFLHLPKSTSA